MYLLYLLHSRVAPEKAGLPANRNQNPPANAQTRSLDSRTLQHQQLKLVDGSAELPQLLETLLRLPVPNPSNATCNIALPPCLTISTIHSKRTRYPSPAPDCLFLNPLILILPFLFSPPSRDFPHTRATRTRTRTHRLLVLPWQTGDLTAAEAAAEGVTSAGAAEEEEGAEAVEGAAAVMEVVTTRVATTTAATAAASRGPRRRTSSTCQSTTTSRSPSSSTAAARVRFPLLYLPDYLPTHARYSRANGLSVPHVWTRCPMLIKSLCE